MSHSVLKLSTAVASRSSETGAPGEQPNPKSTMAMEPTKWTGCNFINGL
ncbi:MAG: hypothetical protein ACPGYZ_04295 [Flavobacteriales bacterium]